MGHSAGAHSACLVGLDPVYLKAHGGSLGWIRGVVSMSAPYEFDPGKEFLYRDLFLPPSIATPPCPLSKSAGAKPLLFYLCTVGLIP